MRFYPIGERRTAPFALIMLGWTVDCHPALAQRLIVTKHGSIAKWGEVCNLCHAQTCCRRSMGRRLPWIEDLRGFCRVHLLPNQDDVLAQTGMTILCKAKASRTI